MGTKEDYQQKLAEITAITEDRLIDSFNIPVENFVQEAENLFNWSHTDREELIANGLAWEETVMEIPVRSGALREAESLWNGERTTRSAMAKQWAAESQGAYELREELVKVFRFAYRKDKERLNKVKEIAKGKSNSHLLQSLNDLSVMGKNVPEPLTAVNFDLDKLEQAAQVSDELSALLAGVATEKKGRAVKKIRDQAYVYLKEVVDEIKQHGKYVFQDNEERRIGYRSKYLRKMYLKRASQPKPETEETQE